MSDVLDTRPHPTRPGRLRESLLFAGRGVRRVRQVPEQLIDATVGPVGLLLGFTYLFGGSIAGSTGDYLQYLLPGILVLAVLFTTVYSGVTLATEHQGGLVDRFRALPVWPAAPLVGMVVGDAVRFVLAAAVVVVAGLVLGYDAAGGPAGVLAAVALVVLAAFALSWVPMVLGLLLRSASAVQGAGMTLIFGPVFLSNVFVDQDTLPSVLQAVVAINPVTHLADAVRGLLDGRPDGATLLLVLAECTVVTAVFATLTVRLYRRG